MPPSAPKSLSATQWEALLAIADGFVGASPSLDPTTTFDAATPSTTPAFTALLIDVLDSRIPSRAQKEIALFLALVSGPCGYALNARRGKLWEMSRDEVEQVIRGWLASRLPPVRMGAKGVGHLVRYLWLRTVPGLYEAIGYPGVPQSRARNDSTPATTPDLLERASPSPVEDGAVEITTGVLVIGSGSGGTAFSSSFIRTITSSPNWESCLDHPTSSNRIADVLILERGRPFAPRPGGAHLPDTEAEGMDGLWENGGVIISEESAISIGAGSTLGGGSRVNWSACLQTDYKVREEWTAHMLQGSQAEKDKYGRMFLGSEWQDCLDTVEKHLGVRLPEKHEHSPANHVLLEGARRMGYAARPVPQNIRGALDSHAECGAQCTLGCRADDGPDGQAGKNSGCRAFLAPLQRAEAHGPTVEVMTGFEVDRIVFDPNEPDRAIGAIGWSHVRDEKKRVFVRAKLVVLSAGSLHTPAILLRSGVSNPHLGKHLALHPTTLVYSTWPQRIDPWRGTILTSVITEFDNLDGAAHGVKIETNCNTPALGLLWAPWEGSAAAWRARVRRFGHTMSHVVICRERDTGAVRLDEKGRAVVSYVPSAFDRAHLMRGVIGLARLLYAMGAEEIYTGTVGAPIWRRGGSASAASASAAAETADGGTTPLAADTRPPPALSHADDPTFQAFLTRLAAVGNDTSISSFGSAHQMGSCRLSSSRRYGVLDPCGRVWGKRGLWVADASAMPGASGVNPMIGTMGLGEWVGRRAGEEVRGWA